MSLRLKLPVPTDIAHRGVSAFAPRQRWALARWRTVRDAAGQHAVVIRRVLVQRGKLYRQPRFQRRGRGSHRQYWQLPRITARGNHHAQRGRVKIHSRFSRPVCVKAAGTTLPRSELHAQHDRLEFRIAEAAVELDNAKVALFCHQTGATGSRYKMFPSAPCLLRLRR